MGSITKRTAKSGKISYVATVRQSRQGNNFSQSKSFSKESLAKEWIRKIEAELELGGNIGKKPINDTLATLLLRYRDEVADQFNPKYTANLNRIASYPIAKKSASSLTRQDFTAFAMWRFRGDDGTAGVTPSTIKGDFSFFSAMLDYAVSAWGLPLETVQFELQQAATALRKRRIITNSKSLDRLPTNDELTALTDYFYQAWRRGRTTVPMHLVIWLAIYTTRRQDELMNLRLSDFDRHNSQWLVRDIKNPDGSLGNHKYAHLEPAALVIIDELLKPEVRNRMIYSGYDTGLLIPANARTVGSYFSRACHICQIEGLRFHDLRHEGATRLAEDHWSIPQIQTVTLHSSWKSLQRYVNLKKRAQRIEYWDILAKIDSSTPTQSAPMRHINEMDIKNAQIALDRAILTQPHTPYPAISALLDDFIAHFRPAKSIFDGFSERTGIDDLVLFDGLRRQFVIDYTQKSWEKWLSERMTAKIWSQMPNGTTHFNYRHLDAIKIDGKRIYRYDAHWVDITAYADGVVNQCLTRTEPMPTNNFSVELTP